MNDTARTTTSQTPSQMADRATTGSRNPVTGTVRIFGAVLVPTRVTGAVARHAPAPAHVSSVAGSAGANEPDETSWFELERVMAARAASMAAHPTARPTYHVAAHPASVATAPVDRAAQVVHNDLCTPRRKKQGVLTTESTPGSGYDSNTVFERQISHGILLSAGNGRRRLPALAYSPPKRVI